MRDVHQHYCRSCRAPWEHDGDQIPRGGVKAAHRCPTCGTEGYVKYYGTETHDEMVEMETLCKLSEDDRVPDHVRDQAARDFSRMAQRLHRPNEPALETETRSRSGLWSLRPPYDAPEGLDELLDLIRGSR